MSGFLGVLASLGGLTITPGFTANLENTSIATPGPYSASLTLTSAGTSSVSGGTSTVSGNWATPAFAGVGDSWWVRFSRTSSQSLTLLSGTESTWLSLSSARSVSYQNSSSILEGTATLNIEFANDASGITGYQIRTAAIDVGYIA
jgi:hypothetical protein